VILLHDGFCFGAIYVQGHLCTIPNFENRPTLELQQAAIAGSTTRDTISYLQGRQNKTIESGKSCSNIQVIIACRIS